MSFDTPTTWEEALVDLDSLGLMPTEMSSRELRSAWGPALRERSLFSARTTKAQLLQGYRERIAELLQGQTNIATARMEMQELLDSMGYDAERGGFPDEPGEPVTADSLQDLRSDARIDLVLDTNTRQVANYALREAGLQDSALYWFPAWELVRLYRREVPRGMRRTKGGLVEEPGESWVDRWEEAGGQFFDGHMIALKDDPIWRRLGDSSRFDDGLDTDYPPFAFNSGYGWEAVPREHCIQLGLISEGENLAGRGARGLMNETLSASAEGLSDEDLRAISRGLKTEREEGRLRLKASGYDYVKGEYVQ